MRTTRSLTVCFLGGVLLLGGVCFLGGSPSGGSASWGGYPSWGGLLLGGVSQHALRQTPPVDRQTTVKILPWLQLRCSR